MVRSNDNNRKMQGKIKQTPTQQSKFHVVVHKMQGRPYRAMQGSAAQICQGWVQWVHQRRCASTPRMQCTPPKLCTLPKASTLSMPKMACTLPIASTVSMPYGVYVSQGEYGEYIKGGCICWGGPKQASCQRRQQRTPCQGWQLVEYNDEPLTTIGDWTTTFSNCEGPKRSQLNWLFWIAIPYHCKSVTAPAMKLVWLWPSSQQMRQSKTFCVILWQATLTRLHHTTTNVVDHRMWWRPDCATQIALAKLIPMEQQQHHPMQQQYWSAKPTILSLTMISPFDCRWALRVSTADYK